MVLDLFSLASIPIASAVYQNRELGRTKTRQDGKSKHEIVDVGPTKYNLDVFCDTKSRKRAEVDRTVIVLRSNKLYLAPRDRATDEPIPTSSDPEPHPFTGFFLQYETESIKTIPGLVSTLSADETPLLNWIYVNEKTMEVKYGSRAHTQNGIVGPFDWTDTIDADGVGLTLDGFEGFCAVEEKRGKGDKRGEWALYFDKDDDGLKGVESVQGKRCLSCSVERRLV
ncbi:hypothetical protein K402DRAFT_315868, partial [Aulographum hederae CBS 113979]